MTLSRNRRLRTTGVVLGCSLVVSALAPAGRAAESASLPRDTVVQRDDQGRVRVRREMKQDASGNWQRDGRWQQWSPTGELVESGDYAAGRREGRWTRWLHGPEAGSLAGDDTQFELPLVSQGDFRGGRLTGEWVVFDAAARRVLRGEFVEGRRQGEFTRWTAAGAVELRQAYDAGLPVGPRRRRDAVTGELAVTAVYLEGYRVVAAESPAAGGGRMSGQLLIGPETPVELDDFAASQLARYVAGRHVLRHGGWQQWSANGQLVMSGEFDRGRAGGRFEWRHPNGQLAVAGSFDQGHPAGAWQWWNAGGERITSGELPSPSNPVLADRAPIRR